RALADALRHSRCGGKTHLEINPEDCANEPHTADDQRIFIEAIKPPRPISGSNLDGLNSLSVTFQRAMALTYRPVEFMIAGNIDNGLVVQIDQKFQHILEVRSGVEVAGDHNRIAFRSLLDRRVSNLLLFVVYV